MSDVAILIADMIAAGVDAGLIGRVAQALSEREPVLVRDEHAERRRERDRDRKRVRRLPQTSADSADKGSSKEVSPAPLQETQLQSPPSPPKGGSSPTRGSPTKADLDGIWEITPKPGRERSSRKDLERALISAMRRGYDPERIKGCLVAAYASSSFSGEHAKGVHRLIENDRWLSFTEDVVAGPVHDPARDAEIRRRMIELADARAANA